MTVRKGASAHGVDRERNPHIYTGPDTRWGLRQGAPCRIVGGATGGGKRIVTEDGKGFTVGAHQVEKAP